MKVFLILFILGLVLRKLEPKDKRIDLIDKPNYDNICNTLASIAIEVIAIMVYPFYKLLLFIWNE